MRLEPIVEELEKAAAQLSIAVKYEAINSVVGPGGLCKVKGQYRVIMDKRASAGERAGTLAKALSGFDLSEVELSASARSMVAVPWVSSAQT